MPGKILDVRVQQGDKVEEGDTLLIMEAMKMELTIKGPDGRRSHPDRRRHRRHHRSRCAVAGNRSCMTDSTAANIAHLIADEIGAHTNQVMAAVRMLDEGATVPFIARYRKEVTGGLDDTQLRNLESRLGYLRELEDRRSTVLATIAEQGKLTDELRTDIENAETKARLEDLYLPYKTQAPHARPDCSRSRAGTAARCPAERPGAGPASHRGRLRRCRQEHRRCGCRARWRQANPDRKGPASMPTSSANCDPGTDSAPGWSHAWSKAGRKKAPSTRDYFDYSEPLNKAPSHRVLAMLRGRNEGVLNIELEPGNDAEAGHAHAIARVADALGIDDRKRPAGQLADDGRTPGLEGSGTSESPGGTDDGRPRARRGPRPFASSATIWAI